MIQALAKIYVGIGALMFLYYLIREDRLDNVQTDGLTPFILLIGMIATMVFWPLELLHKAWYERREDT